MCKRWVTRYKCGHEETDPYRYSCTKYIWIPEKEACWRTQEIVTNSKEPCKRENCHFAKCIKAGGWGCCECDKGPNFEMVCEQNRWPDGMTVFECGHKFCDKCLPKDKWEAKKKKEEKKESK